MKKFSQFCLFLSIVLATFSSYSSHSTYTSDEDEIELHGDLSQNATRSLQQEPIEATISPTSLNISLANNLGDINIEVTSASGNIMYSSTVNTQTQTSLSIDVSSWNSGSYQIRFVNSSGQYLEGGFDIL